MITVKAFLAGIQEIVDAKPRYRTGGTGKDGSCDCIGLIMGAITRAGEKWRWLHSTNECRSYMRAMHPLRDSTQLLPGMLVHKGRPPGTKGYSLPERYDDADKIDYYHVGVVTGIRPLRITHCTSWSGGSGIKVDTSIRGWSWYGDCKLVEPTYGGDASGDKKEETEDNPMQYKVTAPSGSTVRVRRSPGGTVMEQLPLGTIVESNGDGSEEWLKVTWTEVKTGYMMTKFLEEIGGGPHES